MATLRFDKFPATPNYLNQNIWFSENEPTISLTTAPTTGVTSADVNKGTEVDILTAGKPYYVSATVQNSGTADSGDVTVHFFLCQLAATPMLSSGSKLGHDAASHISAGTLHSTINFYLFHAHQHSALTLGDNCLVGVLQEGNSENDYIFADGRAKDKVVNSSDPIIAQHNITVNPAFRRPRSWISNFGSINLYGTASSSASSLVLREPDRTELDALRATLGPSANLVRDVTRESMAGLFDSEPNDERPADDQELKRLPVEMVVEGLEVGSTRKIYWGVKLPDDIKGSEDLLGAFMLLEQISEKKEVLGGVAVIALSRDLPVPDYGKGSGY